MTIVFPRQFVHDIPILGLTFDLEAIEELTPTRSGKVISKDLGPSLWRGTWRSELMDDALFGEARAWRVTLMSKEAFYGYDRLRQFPITYPDGFTGLQVGGSQWDGTGTLDTVDPDNKRLTVSAVPVGFTLKPGDYLAFDYATDSRALHMVVAEAVADGLGVITNVEVRPFVQPGWATTDVFFQRPAARMKIVPGSWSAPEEPAAFGRLSFEAIQTL